MKRLLGAIAAVSVLVIAPMEGAAAREHKDIVKPYYDRWGKWQKVRKEMRKRLKEGETFTGDDWFVLASVCAIQPPGSGSMIRDALNKSPCRKQAVEYFVKAAENGTPRGFLEAAQWTKLLGGTSAQAWPYAALAYRFSARDPDLTADARAYIGKIGYSPSEVDTHAVNRTAMQLVANGIYPADGVLDARQLAATGRPELSWLDFADPATCEWSREAVDVMNSAVKYSRGGNGPAVPSAVSFPNQIGTIMSRIDEDQGDGLTHFYVDVPGKWHGLDVVGLKRILLYRSDSVNSWAIRFRQSPSEVISTVKRLGFPVNANGSTRYTDVKRTQRFEDGYSEVVIDEIVTLVEADRGETVFYCSRYYAT